MHLTPKVAVLVSIYYRVLNCGANVGNVKIDSSRSIHLSFKTIFSFLSIYFAKLWYDSLLWNRGARKINFAEIGSKV